MLFTMGAAILTIAILVHEEYHHKRQDCWCYRQNGEDGL
jgi:hypothetical protein